MPEKPNREKESPGINKIFPFEKPESENDDWSDDQKKKSYYYDDSHGYVIYDPDEDDDEAEEEPKNSAKNKTIRRKSATFTERLGSGFVSL